MRKSKLRVCGLILALAMLAGVPALAQVTFQGTVVSSKTIVVNAPFGGIVDEINLRKGDPVKIGEPVATIRTTKVFAEMDGTVSGIFAREGDQCEGITERYGAEMYLEPVNRYVVSATTEKAYNSSETRYIHIGERVHLACTKDGTHVGTAVVTNVGGATSGDSGGRATAPPAEAARAIPATSWRLPAVISTWGRRWASTATPTIPLPVASGAARSSKTPPWPSRAPAAC